MRATRLCSGPTRPVSLHLCGSEKGRGGFLVLKNETGWAWIMIPGALLLDFLLPVVHLPVAPPLEGIPTEFLLVAEGPPLAVLLLLVESPLPDVLLLEILPPDHCAIHLHAPKISYPSSSPLLPLHPPQLFDSYPKSAIALFLPQRRKCGDFGTATKNPRPPSSYYLADSE